MTLSVCLLFSSFTSANSEQLTPGTARQVQIAYELQLKEKPHEAIQLLEKLKTSKKYDLAYVRRMLGGLYWQREQTKQAIKALTLAVDAQVLAQDQQLDTLRMLADILLMEGEYQSAESYYQKLVPLYQQASDLEWVWLRIAQAQYQQEKWVFVEASINHQQRYLGAANLQPKVLPLNIKLGAQLAQQKWQSALSTALSLRTLEPNNYRWWRQLVTLYMHTQQQDQALITLQQADRAGFELSEQYLKLMAQLYSQKGVPQKAAQIYVRLISLNNSAELLAQQATYWQLAKEWDNAGESWLKAAILDSRYYWQHTLLMLKLNDYNEALASVSQINEQTNEVLLVKIQVLSALGKNKQALQVATQLHKLAPSDESLRWIQYLSRK